MAVGGAESIAGAGTTAVIVDARQPMLESEDVVARIVLLPLIPKSRLHGSSLLSLLPLACVRCHSSRCALSQSLRACTCNFVIGLNRLTLCPASQRLHGWAPVYSGGLGDSGEPRRLMEAEAVKLRARTNLVSKAHGLGQGLDADRQVRDGLMQEMWLRWACGEDLGSTWLAIS